MHTRRSAVALIAICLGAACAAPPADDPAIHRQRLFDEITPVKLANCEFERVGEATDGGYVMCRNLKNDIGAVYSYGIAGADNWGCSLSYELKVPVHQYDCFNTTAPKCGEASSMPTFHPECVGPARETIDGRPFDTVAAHLERNGDTGRQLLMKMDVEGSEWASFMNMSDDLLQKIAQLSVEFHDLNKPEYAEVLRKLKRFFYIVNVHYNNWACDPKAAPFPATAVEILFVNKSLGTVDPSGTAEIPNALDYRNNVAAPDCQLPGGSHATATESKSPR